MLIVFLKFVSALILTKIHLSERTQILTFKSKKMKIITILLIIFSVINLNAQTQGAGNTLNFFGGNKVETSIVDLLGSSNDFTISTWVNPGNTQQNYADIIDWSHAFPNQANFVIQQEGATTIFFSCAFRTNTGIWEASHGVQLVAGEWQQLTFTKKGSSFYSYLNGILINTKTVQVGMTKKNLKLIIAGNGVSTFSSRYFNGKIDEVCIWDRALSQTEIRKNMNKKLTGNESGLVAYYRMDEGTGTTVEDSSPNTNTGILKP